jgi:hypothetical protein
MSTSNDWAAAYARQANADFDTWEELQASKEVPECHKLLFLQMACEKLAKAHLCGKGSDPKGLQASHAYIAKTIPIIVLQQISSSSPTPKKLRFVAKRAKHLAAEIELLAPAVRRGGQRLDNCEYPWEDAAGEVHVPLDWTFTPSTLLTEPHGPTFLKLVRVAIRRFL